ncbi:MAG TPA: RNA polymerase sigma-70 factor [Opitutaceae bacterium]
MLETFNTHRGLLFGIAYRMLGRVSDAEDMVQDVWLRWQKQDAGRIHSPKAWLVSAMTRRCVDQLRLARREREDYYGVWLPEPLMPTTTDPEPGAAAELSESLTMAFMMMLESLKPTERAVFLLREVFDYDYADIAAILGKSEANCRQIVRRAKTHLQEPAATRPVTPPTPQARELVEHFLAATASGEVTEVLARLTEDCTVYSDGGGRVKAAGRPIEGNDHVSRFLLGIWPRLLAGMERRLVEINGRPGLVMSAEGRVHYAFSFELADHRVRAIYIICNPDKLRHLAPLGSP